MEGVVAPNAETFVQLVRCTHLMSPQSSATLGKPKEKGVTLSNVGAW